MRGGKRKGAGRKEVPYETAMVRVPLPLLDAVRRMIETFREKAAKG